MIQFDHLNLKQEILVNEDDPDGERVSMRAGIHCGPVGKYWMVFGMVNNQYSPLDLTIVIKILS